MLYDAAAGLYLTKTRAYNPKTGRFLQRDILDEKGRDGVYAGFPFGADAIGTNLYAWCKNNPVNMEDPSGEWGLRSLIRGAAQVARKFLSNPRGYIAGAANFTYGAARAAGAYQSAARAAVQVAKTVQTVTKTVVGKWSVTNSGSSGPFDWMNGSGRKVTITPNQQNTSYGCWGIPGNVGCGYTTSVMDGPDNAGIATYPNIDPGDFANRMRRIQPVATLPGTASPGFLGNDGACPKFGVGLIMTGANLYTGGKAQEVAGRGYMVVDWIVEGVEYGHGGSPLDFWKTTATDMVGAQIPRSGQYVTGWNTFEDGLSCVQSLWTN